MTFQSFNHLLCIKISVVIFELPKLCFTTYNLHTVVLGIMLQLDASLCIKFNALGNSDTNHPKGPQVISDVPACAFVHKLHQHPPVVCQ